MPTQGAPLERYFSHKLSLFWDCLTITFVSVRQPFTIWCLVYSTFYVITFVCTTYHSHMYNACIYLCFIVSNYSFHLFLAFSWKKDRSIHFPNYTYMYITNIYCFYNEHTNVGCLLIVVKMSILPLSVLVILTCNVPMCYKSFNSVNIHSVKYAGNTNLCSKTVQRLHVYNFFSELLFQKNTHSKNFFPDADFCYRLKSVKVQFDYKLVKRYIDEMPRYFPILIG